MANRFAVMLCLGLLASGWVHAATPPAVPIADEPAHHLVLQNDSVRVFEILLPVGTETLWHVHQRDGLSVRLADATIEDEPQGGAPRRIGLRQGEVNFGATPVALTHRVRNVGDTPFHNIYIELQPVAAGTRGESAGPVADTDGRKPAFENEQVRALRRTLAPGEATAMHTHSAQGVAVPVTAGRLQVTLPDGSVRIVEFKAGQVQWIVPGTTHALRNVGAAPVEMVDVELR